jgi:hypothetical protein
MRRRPGLTGCCLLLAVALLAGCDALAEPPALREGVFPSPVAFVTAAPLPEATGTPTLVPTVAPTAPPPTAVPKRLPIDSTSAIGLWSDRITSTQAFTGYVDVVQGPAGFELNQVNLALVTLNARQVWFGFRDNLADVLRDHPGWVLYDRNKKVAVTAAGDPLLDIRSDEVKAQLADDAAALVAGPGPGYDGIVLDGVGEDLIRKTTPPVYTGTKTFTEDQRREAAEGLLRSIRARIPDKLVIAGGYAWKDGTAYAAFDAEALDLSAIVDGAHLSEFLHAPVSKTVDFKPEAAWKRDVDALSALSQDDRIVLVSTRVDPAGVPTDTLRQWLNYSVASYLLGKDGSRTYFQFDPGGSIEPLTDPIMTAPIGAPLEAYTKLDSGAYQRRFANGIVLVNPTAKPKEIELDAEYLTLSGAAIQKVTMTANTGLILLKP